MIEALKISDDQKPAINAVLARLRKEAFAGDRKKTSTFLKACLGDFGIPEPLQETTLKALLTELTALKNTKPASTSPAPENPAPPEAGPRIVSIAFDKKPDLISIRTKECDEKPRNGKLIGRLLVSTPTQKNVFVDSLKPEQLNSKKTLENAFGKDEHSLNVKTGDPVSFVIKFFDGTQTPPFKTTWPWKNT